MIVSSVKLSDTSQHNGENAIALHANPSTNYKHKVAETLPSTPAEADVTMSFSVQWVEKFHDSNLTHQGRRVFWGRVATGTLRQGQSVKVFPSGQTATVAQVLSATRHEKTNITGQSAGLVLDQEVDV